MKRKTPNEIKILVAFGSKYGSTSEIAERIVTTLREKGIMVDTLNLNTQKFQSQFNIEKYTGFIIGSGIYVGRWTSEIDKFIAKNSSLLKQKTLAAFVVCGEAKNREKKEKSRINFVEKYLDKWQISPDLWGYCGGFCFLRDGLGS